MIEYLLALIIAFVIAYVIYDDAIKRGETKDSALGWAVSTFLLMILALPMYYFSVVRKSRTQQPAYSQPLAQITRVCPQCGRNLSSLPDDISNCPYCGKKFIR